MLLGMALGMEMEGDTGGDAGAMDLNMDLDNVDLLDQHPSTIAGRGNGAR